MREMLPLWKLGEGAMSSVWPVYEVRLKCLYRNGTEMRKMLPLWKGDEGAMSPGRPVEGVRMPKGRFVRVGDMQAIEEQGEGVYWA